MAIQAVNADIAQQAHAYQQNLTKPAGSLGKLEEIACWFAARQGKVIPDPIQAHIAVFAGDHGICEEGVSAFPSVVTGEMVKNFAAGGAAINVLARQADASLSIVDVGVAVDTTHIPDVIQCKVRAGTSNSLRAPAMSQTECEQAIQCGKQEALSAISKGANLLIAGDMGIGNTTASACLIALFTNSKPEAIVGRGTGIDDATHAHKIDIVKRIIARVRAESAKPHQYLQQAGGLEIAAMTGFYVEAAKQGIPVVLDGFISAAAALAAQSMEPEIHQWMLSSHLSQENGHGVALNHLKLEPLLDFHLRLGEGSGAALVLPLLQSAIALHREMATFSQAEVSNKTA